MDMVIVLSNLLDNAIRAAAQALPPEVYVRIRKTPEEYLLSVRNRVQDDLELEDNKLPGTTKKESGHGMGLANVQKVLRKYGAEYTVSCRDRWCKVFPELRRVYGQLPRPLVPLHLRHSGVQFMTWAPTVYDKFSATGPQPCYTENGKGDACTGRVDCG